LDYGYDHGYGYPDYGYNHGFGGDWCDSHPYC
jgi:hypothetical protein